jgi:hypothetical protein
LMLELDKYDGGLFDFLVPIHDAVLVETDEENGEKVGKLITAAQGRAWSELGGLIIDAEFKVGTNWGSMEGED